jgi:enamine deaminase RidA (YjgF/YER057c/UK114 family)
MRLALALLFSAGLVWLGATVGSFGRGNHAADSTQTAAKKEAQVFRIFNPDTMAKLTAGYSHVAEVSDGKLVYIAGQVAIDRSGSMVGKDDLKAAVEASGGSFHDVIKLNYFCAESVDPSQVPVVREIRDKYVNTANPPVSTFVVVKRLVRPEWLIEVEAVAVVKK